MGYILATMSIKKTIYAGQHKVIVEKLKEARLSPL